MRLPPHHRITAADRRGAARFVRDIRRTAGARRHYASIDELVAWCEPLVGPVTIVERTHRQWIDEPGTLTTGVSFLRGPASTDVIVIRDDLDGLHRAHVIAHELGHLLGRDYVGRSPGGPLRDCTHGHPGDGTVSLATPEERRAEAFAALACTRLVVPVPVIARRRFDWAG
ncbi:ImmA/IrrE family metallo-endopeptidase [Pseudonocardia sp. HH130630-07]|uniref:ImmA/IrrE family metallo-endopeptidase n=1 Tax=Pseudonocardia sp. HH130630-07 TaxID=1690815 RepID=UPI000814EF5C|nr:hypothetical protein [Pseudonocardia sp. HH130630-07]ANY05570.1 hypothetical protein AFB00_03780 [Pseudonocardia sp. HH130630-07]